MDYAQSPIWCRRQRWLRPVCRESYLLWRDSGRRKQGVLFESMKRHRAYFKYVLRSCKSADCSKQADSLANKLLLKDDKNFWKEIKNINNNSNSFATSVNNATGCKNITDMWKNHYNGVLNSTIDTSKKSHVMDTIMSGDLSFSRFSIDDVLNGMKALKNGKASGFDNLSAEHFKYAHDKVAALLAIIFNAMLIHNYLPSKLLDTIIVPILKDKCGEVTDKDNYRPLALTCVASKILEFVILHRYKHLLHTTDNQFGFKEQSSTEMCIFTLKHVIDYYTNFNSPVYVCF